MVTLVFLLLSWSVAFSVGFGWLAWPWLLVCLLCGYARAILISARVNRIDDFREVGDQEFKSVQSGVFLATALTLIPVAIWYGIGRLVS